MPVRPVLAAVATSVLLAGCGSSTQTGAPPTSNPPVTVPSSASSSTTTTTTTTTTTVPPPPAWAQGSSGPEVAALQARLQRLGYWLDDEEGSFGSSTAHAVTAFQKRAGLDRDGVAGPVTLDALTTATRPEGQSTEGRVVEIDLDTQTLLLVEDGVVRWVFDTSTGARAGTTPRGHWAVYRAVDGYDRSPLGVLYRPKYFYEGVAVHGYPSVPPYPASHGCVRVLNAAMDYLWSTGALDRGTPVWVY